MCKVVFRDDAETAFEDAESTDAPFTGDWRPDDPLAPLIESPVDGTWQLQDRRQRG